MIKIIILGFIGMVGYLQAQNQTVSDLLLIQDFENSPASPTWNYTGTPDDIESGNSSGNAIPPNSPLGINGSNAWHVRDVSLGNPLTFDNYTVPSGYDNLTASFRLAAINVQGTKLREAPIQASGRARESDDVLVEISTDGGATFYPRARVKGINTSSVLSAYWPYAATGVAEVAHLPMTEAVFQPADGGIRTTDGFSTVNINFSNTVTQLQIRITPTSNSPSDSWLIDNVTLRGNRRGASIPTMSQWGLLIFGLIIMNLSVFFVQRRELI